MLGAQSAGILSDSKCCVLALNRPLKVVNLLFHWVPNSALGAHDVWR
jgi:hypothetical protein